MSSVARILASDVPGGVRRYRLSAVKTAVSLHVADQQVDGHDGRFAGAISRLSEQARSAILKKLGS
jgi:hypothetical protein